jgi:DeoR/GlpR family transcriptional regulator of sugar metabolism
VGFTAGTTTTEAARCIRHRTGIHVITNAMNIGMELNHQVALDVTLTGGNMHWAGAFSLTGPTAMEMLGGVFLDKAFVGACGVEVLRGATTIEPDEAAMFRAMVRQAKQVIVLADSSKIAMTSPALICQVSDIDILMTDSGITPDALAASRPMACRCWRSDDFPGPSNSALAWKSTDLQSGRRVPGGRRSGICLAGKRRAPHREARWAGGF